MKNNNALYIKICVLVVIAIILCAILVVLLSFRGTDFYFGSNDSSNLVIDETYSLSEVNKISADLNNADIRFEYSNSDEIQVQVYDKDDKKVSVKNNGGELSINFTGRSFCIGICVNNNRRVVVTLPDNYDKDIAIESASGDVNISDVSKSKVTVKTVSGDVNIGNAEELKVVTTSGDIDIDNATVITGSTTSGDIQIYKVTESIDFSSVSGDIEIGNGELTKNSKLSTVSGDVEIERLNRIYVSTSTVSGETEVNGSDRTSNIELSIKTTSGDIEVN